MASMDKGSSYMEIKAITTINPASMIGACMIWLGASIPGHATVIINEIDYDQPGADVAEFIELFNSDTTAVTLDGYTLDLVNGSSGNTYLSLDLSGLSIAANGYIVLCGDITAVGNCNTSVATGSWLQNGGSSGDAVALLLGAALLDSVVYEGIGSHLGFYAEGNSFADADSGSISMSIARLPDGLDSDHNASDFGSACLTPGSANIGGTGDCSASLNPVPVPAAAWLFGSGLIGLVGIGRRKLVD